MPSFAYSSITEGRVKPKHIISTAAHKMVSAAIVGHLFRFLVCVSSRESDIEDGQVEGASSG